MVLVVLFFILSFMAIGGTYLNINPYDSYVWVKTIIHFVFLIFTMMAIPFCYKKFSKNTDIKKGRNICKWNCVGILSLYFIIDVIILGGIFDETFQNLGANLVYALMFYYINRKLFFNNITSTEFAAKKEIEEIAETSKAQNSTNLYHKKTPKKRYCSHCGNLIDSTTKKCCGCGKQYFKGISWNKVLPIFVVSFLAISLVVNVLLVIDNINSKNNIDKLELKLTELEQENSKPTYSEFVFDTLKEKSDFIDKFVVFVEDDKSNLYHKYECDKFVGEYFWTYNIDAAKEQGYHPCSKCHD